MSFRIASRSFIRQSSASSSCSSAPSTSRGFCTSSVSASSSSSSSKRSRDLSSIFSLYQSSSSFPSVSSASPSSTVTAEGTTPLQHYVDKKLLSRNKTRARNASALSGYLTGEASYSRSNSSGREPRPSYMFDEPIDEFDSQSGNPFPATLFDIPSGSSSGGGGRRKAIRRAAAIWKPLSEQARRQDRDRARRIVDALSGTVEARYAGKEMVEEGWETIQKRVEELLSPQAEMQQRQQPAAAATGDTAAEVESTHK